MNKSTLALGLLTLATITAGSLLGCEGDIDCGPGTTQSGRSCIANSETMTPPGTTGDGGTSTALKPMVKSISLTALSLDASGRPFYSTYPVTGTATLTVTGEPFQTDVWFGLESTSTKQRCVIGSTTLKHNPTDPTVAATYTVSNEWIIPRSCEAVAHATDVHGAVAFDPYGQTVVVGRTASPMAKSAWKWRPLDLDGGAGDGGQSCSGSRGDDDGGSSCPIDDSGAAPPEDGGGETTMDVDIDAGEPTRLDASPGPSDADVATQAASFGDSEVTPSPDCLGCSTIVDIEVSPGKSIEILSATLGSSVGQLEFAVGTSPAYSVDDINAANQAAGQPVPPAGAVDASAPVNVTTSGVPHFVASLHYRTLGLDYNEVQSGKDLSVTAQIRPLPGGADTGDLDPSLLGWLPISAARSRAPGTADTAPVFSDQLGGDDPQVTFLLQLEGATFDTVASGQLAEQNEFELQLCVAPTFPLAKITETGDGGVATPINNCFSGPVTITRAARGPNGPAVSLDATDTSPSMGATSFNHEYDYVTSTGDPDKINGTFSAWATSGYTTDDTKATSFGLGGSAMYAAGGWYEAGSSVQSCVLGHCVDIAKAVVTFKDYQSRTDIFSVVGRILAFDFIPDVSAPLPDGKLTLRQLLDAVASVNRSESIPTSKSFEEVIYEEGFTIPVINKGIDVNVSAFIDLGLDDSSTAITKTPVKPNTSTACSGYTVHNGQCFFQPYAAFAYQSLSSTDQNCGNFGGYVPMIRDNTDRDLALAAAGGASVFANLSATVQSPTGSVNGPGLKTILTAYRAPTDNFYNTSALPYTSLTASTAGNYAVLIDGTTKNASLVSPATTVKNIVCGKRDTASLLGGSTISASIVPFVRAGVTATAEFDILIVSVKVTGVVGLIYVSVPFNGSISSQFYSDGSVALALGRSIDLYLNFLNGGIYISGSVLFVKGSATLFEWNGFGYGMPLLPLETTTYKL